MTTRNGCEHDSEQQMQHDPKQQMECPKWRHNLFSDCDVSPIVQKHVELNDALALRLTDKQAPLAVVFNPKEACELLEAFKMLARNKFEKAFQEACKSAARSGHLQMLQWLMLKKASAQKNVFLSPDVWICSQAALGGHLHVIKWAHAQGYQWDADTSSNAALGGHLECLKWLHQNGCAWDRWTCRSAAENGHCPCLQYAHNHGCAWAEDTCAYAAGGGHLECLQFAHEQGCPWDEQTSSAAAFGCHSDCLKYAYDHGCPYFLCSE